MALDLDIANSSYPLGAPTRLSVAVVWYALAAAAAYGAAETAHLLLHDRSGRFTVGLMLLAALPLEILLLAACNLGRALVNRTLEAAFMFGIATELLALPALSMIFCSYPGGHCGHSVFRFNPFTFECVVIVGAPAFLIYWFIVDLAPPFRSYLCSFLPKWLFA